MANKKNQKHNDQAPAESSKKKRVHFGAIETLALFKATNTVNPYQGEYKGRGVYWDRVAELTSQEAGFDPPVKGQRCQEKVSEMLKRFTEGGTKAFSNHYSEADLVSLASTLDLVRGKKEKWEEEKARKKDGKAKAILKQEKAGSELVAKSLQLYRQQRAETPPELRDSPRASQSAEAHSRSHSEDPERPTTPSDMGPRSPSNSPPAPAIPANSSDSTHSSVPLTRALRTSLNHSNASSAQRFERKYVQLVRQTECLESLATSAERIANVLEGKQGLSTSVDAEAEAEGADDGKDSNKDGERAAKRARLN
ncbi:hypothetical protein FRC07_006383 [Ceratobasidium sp. 392]|nr:hypothetical protein FRC07_006383 [Ceratobasidium sp. 392]